MFQILFLLLLREPVQHPAAINPGSLRSFFTHHSAEHVLRLLTHCHLENERDMRNDSCESTVDLLLVTLARRFFTVII